MDFNWGEIFKAAIPAAINAGSQIYGLKAQEDQLKDQRAYNEKLSQLEFDRKKELMGLGGGGGGGGGPFTGFTQPQKVQAMQNQQQQELDAINAIIAAYQRAVLS